MIIAELITMCTAHITVLLHTAEDSSNTRYGRTKHKQLVTHTHNKPSTVVAL